jgi:hypothetical protein
MRHFNMNWGMKMMLGRMAGLALCIVTLAVGASAQTNVTNSNNGTSNTVPVYTGTATLGNSPISVSSSNVGIGTTNPTDALQLAGGNIGIEDTGCGTVRVLDFEASDDSLRSYVQAHSSCDPGTDYLQLGSLYGAVQIVTGASSTPTARVTVLANGNVGIGTTTPSSLLSVGSTSQFQVDGSGNITTTGSANLNSAITFLSLSGATMSGASTNACCITGGTLAISGGNGVTASSSGGDLTLAGGYGDSGGFGHGGNVNIKAGYNIAGSEQYFTLGSINFYTGQTQSLAAIISPSGKVGVGTSAPQYLLDVSGPIRSSSGGIVFPDGSTQTTAYTQLVSGSNAINQVNGNVGIGTTSPSDALTVANGSTANAWVSPFNVVDTNSGGGQFNLSLFHGATSNAAAGDFLLSNNIGNIIISPNASGKALTFIGGYWTNAPSMVIKDGGNIGIGTTTPGAKLEVNGGLKLTANSGASITFQDGTTQATAYTGVTCGGDYAESIDATGDRTKYAPGDVLVLDEDNPGKILKSIEPYSTAVAGIYSTRPGTLGRRQLTPKSDAEVPMAMVGVVPTKVTAENGAIKVGDLLVSSSKPGYAMKGTDRGRMLGAVIGKAMGPLDSETGVIEVLVTLQ